MGLGDEDYEKAEQHANNHPDINYDIEIEDGIRRGLADFNNNMPGSIELGSTSLETNLSCEEDPILERYETAASYEAINCISNDDVIADEPDTHPDRAASYMFGIGLELGCRSAEDADVDDFDHKEDVVIFAYEMSRSMGNTASTHGLRDNSSSSPEDEKIFGMKLSSQDHSDNEVPLTLANGMLKGARLEL